MSKAKRNRSLQSSPMGRGRRWMFRLLALVLVPTLFLGSLELGLRLFGFGVSTSYTMRQTVQGEERILNNPRFFELFFPPHLLPVALPFSLPVQKPAESYRILLLGGSAAMGIPEAAYGMAPMLEEMLRALYPDGGIEVLNLANTAINSHVVERIARESASLEPDLFLVYLGNNEVVGPYGAGTVFTPLAPKLGWIRAGIALKSTRTGQLLDRLMRSLRSPEDQPSGWRGMEMFLQQQVPADHPRLQRVYDNFEQNLEDICETGDRLGIPVVLSTVAVNLRHSGPFASIHAPDLGEEDRARFNAAFDAGRKQQEAGDFEAALASFGRCAQIDSTHADLRYRMGECQLEVGDTLQATESLRQALELDTLRFRADSEIEHLIAEVAERNRDQGVHLARAAEQIAAQSPGNLPGHETLFEHVHLNFHGNYVVARTLLEEVEPLLPPRVKTKRVDAPVLSEAQVARRLAYTPFNRFDLLRQVRALLGRPPFIDQSDHRSQLAWIDTLLKARSTAASPDSIANSLPIYQEAIRRRPDRWILRYRMAAYLGDGLHRPVEAERLWRPLVASLPHFPAVKNALAQSLAAQKHYLEARRLLEQSLRLEPNQPEMMRNLAYCIRQTDPDDAAERDHALELDRRSQHMEHSPGALRHFSLVRNGEAHWRVQHGRLDAAIDLLQEVTLDDPDYLDAHYNLASLLLQRGDRLRARQQFAEVLRIDPRHAAARKQLESLR